MVISFKGAYFPTEVILMGVRWYLAYPLSTRHVEELMAEGGIEVDHATINRWVIKYSPLLEEAFHQRKRPVWVSWRLDETYIKIGLGRSLTTPPSHTTRHTGPYHGGSVWSPVGVSTQSD